MSLSGLPRTPCLSDGEGVRAMYTAYAAELYRFALRSLGDRGAAEDVVQEVFVRAWRAADRYDPEIASLRVWLFAIARNAVIDHARATAVRPTLTSTEVDDAQPASTDVAGDVVRGWLVEEALRRVGEDHRYVVVETYLRGRSPAELATELGIPLGTVRSRMFYALKALRLAMDEMEVTP